MQLHNWTLPLMLAITLEQVLEPLTTLFLYLPHVRIMTTHRCGWFSVTTQLHTLGG